MKNSDHPAAEPSDYSIERLLADCDDALIRGEDPAPLLRRLDEFPAEVRAEFQEVYESLISVRGTLSAAKKSSRFPRPFGKFRLLKILGQGGFGLVFLAEDPELRRKVALKVPRLHQLVAADAEERFLREAQMAAGLEHPHLVPIYESGQAEGLPYLASAYCDGPTLSKWLEERKELLSIRECAELVEVLAEAVSHMHDRKIVHRDLKPSNVLLFPRERKTNTTEPRQLSKNLGDYIPKITDFGLARPHDLVTDLSRTGIFLGTAAYVSPEQAWGKREHVGPASDIYSLGVMLYELLTGQPPFRGISELDTLRLAAAQEPLPPRNLRKDTPRDLETICLKCLEKQPEKRYATMAAIGEELRRFLTGMPILAKPAGYIDKTNKLIRRQPWLTGLAGLAVVLIVAVAIGSYWVGRGDVTPPFTVPNDPDDTNAPLEDVVDWDPLASSLRYATRIQSTKELRNQTQLTELKELLASLIPKPGRPDPRSFEWYYLNNVAKVRVFKAFPLGSSFISHDDSLYAINHDGKSIAIMEVATGKIKKILSGFGSDFPGVHFTRDGSKLVTLDFFKNPTQKGYQGEYKIWDARNDFELIKSKSYEHPYKQGTIIFSLAAEADIFFVLDKSDNFRLRKIDLTSGIESNLQIGGPKEFIVSNPKGDQLLLKRDQAMELWDIRSMKLLKTGIGARHVCTAAFSSNGKYFATDHQDSLGKFRLDLYDATTFDKISMLNLTSQISQIAFDQDSNHLAIRFGNDTYHFYESRTMKFIFETRDPMFLRGFIRDNGVSISNQSLDAKSVNNPHAKILPADSYLPPPLPISEAWCTAFAPSGDMLAVGYDHEEGDNRETLKLWNVKTRTATNLSGHPSTVMGLAYSPDGLMLATAGYDNTVRLWNVQTGKEIQILTGHEASVRTVAFHPDSRTLVSGDKNGVIKIWDCALGSVIASWKAHSQQCRALVFTQDGKRIISAGNFNPIQIWQTSDQQKIGSLGDNTEVQGLALSPDGSMLASAHQNRTVQLWDLREPKLLKTIRTHTNKVRCVTFSPDGKTLVSGGDDHVVRFWNIVAGLETLTIPMEHEITSLSFDSKGKSLSATLNNGFVRVFNGD